MAKQSKRQKKTVERVMHEFKHGELDRAQGGKVKNPKQAVAIALHEAGASKYESPRKNQDNLRKTKAKERNGETAQAEAESATRAELYEKAKRKHVAGRSKMSKDQLQEAVRG